MVEEFGFWALMAGWFACMVVSAIWWKRNLFWRFLPILFGLPAALVVTLKLERTDPALILRDIGTGIALGAVFWCVVWLETRVSQRWRID